MQEACVNAAIATLRNTPLVPAELPLARKYLIFGIMAFGQFMALIDIQIVAASLNDVQAGLSAGPDEISWVQTGYLMAELVMIPFAAFLAQALSTRWLFALSAGLFTLASALCGLAWDIHSMTAFRVVQGFVGGAMVPTVFATGFTLFTGKQRAMIPAILGMISVLAPTLGPTVGGWLTDAIGWRSIFYINIVPGIAVTLLSAVFVKVDAPNLSMLKRIDYVHLGAMAVFLGGLEYVLEEGPRHEWFGDPTIVTAAWLSFVGFALFLERSFRSSMPVVKLSPFRKATFVFACLFSLVIGFGLYSATYLIPVFLGRVRDYNSLQIGTTVFVTGIAQIASVVVAARLSQKIDPRWMIAAGLPLFAASLWLASYMTPRMGFCRPAGAADAARLRDHAVHRAQRDHGAGRLRRGRAALCLRPVQPDAQPRRRDRHRGGQYLAAGPDPHPRRTTRRKPGRGRTLGTGHRGCAGGTHRHLHQRLDTGTADGAG